MVAISNWAMAHKRVVLACWLLLTVAGMAFSGRAVKAFSDQYAVPGSEGSTTNATISRLFGNGGNTTPLVPVVTLPAGTTVDSAGVQSGLRDIAARIERAVPGVRIASYASTGSRAFVAPDSQTTFLVAYPPPVPGEFGQNKEALAATQSTLHGATVAGAPVHLTGIEALTADGTKKSGGIGLLGEALIGGAGALCILAFVFGSFLAVVPLIIALASIMTSFLFVWGLAEATSVSAIVAFLIALLGLGVAIDYSLIIVARWREERSHGRHGEDAVRRAMQTAGRAVVLSGTTVAVGLLALIALPVPYLRSVGYGGMLIPLISVLASITLLPVLLATIGPRLDWPHRRTDARASRFWTRWATIVVRGRWAAAGAGLAVLAVLLVAATSMHLGGGAGNPASISQGGDAATGLTALQRSGVGSGALSPVEILTPAPAASTVVQRIGGIAGVQGAVAPADGAWRSGGDTLVDVFSHDADTYDTLDRVAAAAHAVDPDIRVGGVDAQNEGFISAVYGSFPLMIGLIVVVTFLLLTRAFRSPLLVAKAITLNVVSVAAAWGVLTIVWQDGHGSNALWGIPATGSIPSWLPLIVFAFLFGLSMDYEVFILARMREEYDATGSTDAAVVRGIGRTGRLVTSAALILFLSFASMATAPSLVIKMMATGFGVGILLDATVVRALLVPAAVSLFGRWNWRLPPLAARALRLPPQPAVEPAGRI